MGKRAALPKSRRCIATKDDGTQCGAAKGAGSDYCWAHDPDKSDEAAKRRKRNTKPVAKLPAPIKPLEEVTAPGFTCAADVKAFIEQTLADLRTGSIAANAAQPIASMARLLLNGFFSHEEDLSQVPDALKAMTNVELCEQMAKQIPTPLLKKELASR